MSDDTLERQREISAKIAVVSKRQTTEDIVNELRQLQAVVADLQKKTGKIESIVFSGSISKSQKLQQIFNLTELNSEVSISMVKSELSLNSTNYVRQLMREAAKLHNFYFFKGSTGQESFVCKNKIENKAMHAYAEVYQELLGKPIGTTITESAIAHRFDLNGQELQSVICHLARHSELHVMLPINRKGCRRIKRVR